MEDWDWQHERQTSTSEIFSFLFACISSSCSHLTFKISTITLLPNKVEAVTSAQGWLTQCVQGKKVNWQHDTLKISWMTKDLPLSVTWRKDLKGEPSKVHQLTCIFPCITEHSPFWKSEGPEPQRKQEAIFLHKSPHLLFPPTPALSHRSQHPWYPLCSLTHTQPGRQGMLSNSLC